MNTNPPRPAQGTAPEPVTTKMLVVAPNQLPPPKLLPSSTRTQPCCFIPTRSATISQTPSVVLAHSPFQRTSLIVFSFHLLLTSITSYSLFTRPAEYYPFTHSSADRLNLNHLLVPSEHSLPNIQSAKAIPILPSRLQCRRRKKA